MDLFEVQKLAVEYCYQYLIAPNTKKWDTAVNAFGVGYDIGHNSAKAEIDRLRAENERLRKWVERAEDAMSDAIHTLQNTDEKNWVKGSIDLLNATLKS